MHEETTTFGADPEITTGTRSTVIVRGKDDIEIENQSNEGPSRGLHHHGTRAEVAAFIANLQAALANAEALP